MVVVTIPRPPVCIGIPGPSQVGGCPAGSLPPRGDGRGDAAAAAPRRGVLRRGGHVDLHPRGAGRRTGHSPHAHRNGTICILVVEVGWAESCRKGEGGCHEAFFHFGIICDPKTATPPPENEEGMLRCLFLSPLVVARIRAHHKEHQFATCVRNGLWTPKKKLQDGGVPEHLLIRPPTPPPPPPCGQISVGPDSGRQKNFPLASLPRGVARGGLPGLHHLPAGAGPCAPVGGGVCVGRE